MAETKRFIYEIEPSKPENDGKPSTGPVYRNIFAKDGFPQPPPGMDTCWDIFRLFFRSLSFVIFLYRFLTKVVFDELLTNFGLIWFFR